MKHHNLFISLLFVITGPARAADFYLAIGETVRLKTSPLQEVQVEKKGLLSIKDLGNTLVFTGKKLGTTTVTLGQSQHHFYILHKKNRLTLKQLNKWALKKRGPEIRVHNGDVILQGRILRHKDFQDLINYCDDECRFKIRAEPYPQVKQAINDYVTNILSTHNLPTGDLVFQPELSLRLHSRHKTSQAQYKKILQPYGIQLLFDSSDIAQVPVIKIQVYIAHVKKSFMRNWGVSWPSEATATLLDGQNFNLNPLNVSLKALETQGQGQLLASPTLITESNKQAEFHSGGEFPVTTSTQFNNSVQWKRYGLFLKTKPIANAKGSLKIHIDLEMSTLDQSFSNSEIPALIRSNVKTQVNMEKPQPILLSGFLRQDRGNNQSGLPWLQQIPIFKPLFSTGNVYDSELELVFILIPSFYEQ